MWFYGIIFNADHGKEDGISMEYLLEGKEKP